MRFSLMIGWLVAILVAFLLLCSVIGFKLAFFASVPSALHIYGFYRANIYLIPDVNDLDEVAE